MTVINSLRVKSFMGNGELLTVDCWLLAVDCWLLAVGCWLLTVKLRGRARGHRPY
ncbi:hypothetical protein QT970_25090 [Microcoleus sp. herbarium8]|uniref:hypothetical protein n=1 Tax=Microcoleus sp. herbarium8 TaxID=3055436 RepID=UPI002FD3D8B7